MSFQDEIARDVKETEGEAPSFFTWRGTDYPCTPDKFTREVIVSDDGNPIQIDLSIRCRVDLFPDNDFPKSGETVIFPSAPALDATEYRVRRTRSKHFAILWVDCVDLNV